MTRVHVPDWLWTRAHHHPGVIWGLTGTAAVLATVAAVAVARRWRRPTTEAAERSRRLHLNAVGRIAGGEILDMYPARSEDPLAEGLAPTLVYQYQAGGVVYQASQALHLVPIQLDPTSWIPGWPVQVKFDPANPGNSIVACEHWNGLATRARAAGAGVGQTLQ